MSNQIGGEKMIAINITGEQYDTICEALEQMDCLLQKKIKNCVSISKRKELKMKSMDIEELFIVMAGEDDGI